MDANAAALISYAGRWVEPRYDATSGSLREDDGSPSDFRSTAISALFWAEKGRYDYAARSAAFVLDYQRTDPADSWCGGWANSPAATTPQANWHTFIGAFFVVLERRHGDRLPPALRIRLRDGLLAAAKLSQRRPNSLAVTNLVILSGVLQCGAGEIGGDDALAGSGRQLLQALASDVAAQGLAEFNSPNYGLTQLSALGFAADYLQDAEARTAAGEIRRALWWGFTRRYWPGNRQLAGPFGRSSRYDRMRYEPTGMQLAFYRDSGGRIPLYYAEHLSQMNRDLPLMGVLMAVVKPSCPTQWMDEALTTAPRRFREQTRVYSGADAGCFQQTATYCSGPLSVGSVNRASFTATVDKGDGRPVVAYIGDSLGRQGLFRIVMECSSRVDLRFLTTAQKDGALLVVPSAEKYLVTQPRDFTIRLQWFGNRVSPVAFLGGSNVDFGGAFGVGWMGQPVFVRVSPRLMSGGTAIWSRVVPSDPTLPTEAILRLTLPDSPSQGGQNTQPAIPAAFGIYFGASSLAALPPVQVAPDGIGMLYSWQAPNGLLQQRLPIAPGRYSVEQWIDGATVTASPLSVPPT